jgi:hypothetical protein
MLVELGFLCGRICVAASTGKCLLVVATGLGGAGCNYSCNNLFCFEICFLFLCGMGLPCVSSSHMRALGAVCFWV